MTRISECTDGLSNTMAMGEDAGRDARFPSPTSRVITGSRIMATASSAMG